MDMDWLVDGVDEFALPVPSARPRVTIEVPLPTHSPHLASDDVRVPEVLADGDCMYTCIVACRDLDSWCNENPKGRPASIVQAIAQNSVVSTFKG